MADGFAVPLVSPVMIGRDVHLSALRRGIDAAEAGAGQVILVAGEAGIGKSRLVGEAVAYARDRGLRVLTGQCFAADRAAPYAPLRDLLRSDVVGQPWAEAILVGVGAELGVLLPEFARPGLDEPTGAMARGESDRRRVALVVRALLEAIAAEFPVLLILEDAHWSDDATLDLLVHLARHVRLERCRITIVVTFRDDEISTDLATALAALDRERLAAEARLGHLPRAEVIAMLRVLGRQRGGDLMSASLAETIYRLSEGNPFFVEELLRSAAAAGGAGTFVLPRSVAEAVRQRVALLSDGARRTLTLAAVSGRRFDFDLLQALGAGDEVSLIADIKELIAARLIVEESADRFAFRHALVREAIYDGLLVRERRALHRQALDGILQADPTAPETQTADLARHAVGAEAWAEAVEFGHRGGQQALSLYAPGAAIELLGIAIEACAKLSRPPSARLLRDRGSAHATHGDFDIARVDLEAAARQALVEGNPLEESEALLALGNLWAGRDYEQVGSWIRQALDVAQRSDDRRLPIRLLNRLGNWHANRGETTVALRLHEEALALAEASGDRAGVAEALDLLGITRYLADDYVGAAAEYRRAVPVLREVDDRQTLTTALSMLALTLGSVVYGFTATGTRNGTSSRDLVEESIALARQIGAPSDEAFALCSAALVLGESAAGEALAYAVRALHLAEEIGHVQWTVYANFALACLYEALLDFERAGDYLADAVRITRGIGSSFWLRTVLSAHARIESLGGDLEAAKRAVAEIIVAGETRGRRHPWFAAAEIALAEGNAEEALAIVDRLVEESSDPGGALSWMPELARVRGEALGALGRFDEALDAFGEAREGATDRGHLPFLWKACLSRAALYRRMGQRDEAEADLIAAHEAVTAYADGIGDADLRARFLERAAARMPSPRGVGRGQAEKASAGGLTAREREVAILIAAGHSNREIGDALFMSVRTAGTHVGNILAKLGLKSRAQVAAWVQEHGLASAGED